MRKFAAEYAHITNYQVTINGQVQTVNPNAVTPAQVQAIIAQQDEYILEPIPA